MTDPSYIWTPTSQNSLSLGVKTPQQLAQEIKRITAIEEDPLQWFCTTFPSAVMNDEQQKERDRKKWDDFDDDDNTQKFLWDKIIELIKDRAKYVDYESKKGSSLLLNNNEKKRVTKYITNNPLSLKVRGVTWSFNFYTGRVIWKKEGQVVRWEDGKKILENYTRIRNYICESIKDFEPKGLDINDSEIISASSGSGFFVSKDGHIITNFHVIENCDSIKINFKGKEVVSEIFAIDKMNDLAIIQANIKPLKIFSVSNKDVTLLQDVIVAGFPLGKNVSSAIKMHKGSITALAGYEDNYSNFQTDATINQGNSGGPIIVKKGNVVGVAVATWVEEGVQGIHFGIKSSVLKTFANAKELNFSSPNNREVSSEKLGKLISEATTYLECWMTGAKIKKMIAEADSKKAFFSNFKQ